MVSMWLTRMISIWLKCMVSIWLKLINEALPGGGYLFPCSPEINWLVPLFPKNRKFVFLCSLFPNIVFVPCSPQNLTFFPCSPEINTLFPLFPKTPARATSISIWLKFMVSIWSKLID